MTTEALAHWVGDYNGHGLILLIAVVLSTYWSGLRMGVICSGIVALYVYLIYTFPISGFDLRPRAKWRAVAETGFVFLLFTTIVGLVQNKLRAARIREFDAKEDARRQALHREESEVRLQSSEGLHKLVLDSSMDAVIAIGDDGQITFWNQVAEDIFGWTAQEAIGRNLAETIIPVPERAAHSQGLQNFLVSGHGPILGKRLDLKGLTKDGREIAIELSVVAHKVPEGHVFVGFLRDISDRKKAEEAVRRMNEELEHRVAERTVELDIAIRKLEEQRELALEASRYKSEFVSSMSHELRTPLNAILGFTQLLEMRYDEPELRESTGAIFKAGQHLLNLINEVLDLARIESGRYSLSLEPVSLDEVLTHGMNLVQQQAQKLEVSVSIDKASLEGLYVLADSRRLLQVVINLLSNGIKYNRPGGQVSVWVESGEENHILFVKDTGRGISPNDQRALFQPFVRFGDHTVEGSGLGLLLSRNFIELMGGSLALVKSDNEGSVFSVSLRSTAPPTHSGGYNGVLHHMSSEAIEGKHRVLYIEDNASNFRLAELAFSHWGEIELLGATSGQQGLDIVKSSAVDLILLDLHLPDIHGSEVLRQLKADSATADVPVVILTADATEAQIKRLIAAGADEYLTKPVDLSRLASVVRTNLRKSK